MFFTLFLMMDAIGNIGSFLEVLKPVDKRRYWWVVGREMLIALGFMLFFNFVGAYILEAVNASETAVLISSGMILFIFAIGVLYPSEKNIRSQLKAGDEPFIVPLAVPLIAGPALLATISLYAVTEPSCVSRLEAIFLAWVLSAAILLSGRFWQRVLGNSGLMALERLFALVLVMLATQRIIMGLKLFFTQNG